MTAVQIRPAVFPDDLATVTTLFHEYADSLETDLCFQGFAAELAALPGKYAAPSGTLLLAWRGGQAVGCIAMRPLANGDCEMKRLYVRPAGRGQQLGRQLVARVCACARAAGHARICLDTLPSMTTAIALYTALGFQAVDPYVFNPVPGTLFLARAL
jgi:ribosomal protein S18 acetylase RimI-like enzyme